MSNTGFVCNTSHLKSILSCSFTSMYNLITVQTPHFVYLRNSPLLGTSHSYKHNSKKAKRCNSTSDSSTVQPIVR